MNVFETPIEGLLIIDPKTFEDERGYFMETFNFKRLSDYGVEINFVQDNESSSTFGTIRGLHYQLAPYAQTKLVRVVSGRILDVAVDIRIGSPSYGKHFSIELDDISKKMLLIPKGFAHGFSVLSRTATVLYKCDGFYNKSSERGIIFNDPKLAINWNVDDKDLIVSAKDNVLPLFDSIETNFVYGANY